jgi:hypothetical protein
MFLVWCTFGYNDFKQQSLPDPGVWAIDLVVSVTPACPSTPFGRVKPEKKKKQRHGIWKQYIILKCQYTYTRLSVISQKMKASKVQQSSNYVKLVQAVLPTSDI